MSEEEKPSGIYGRLVDYTNYWFTQTPPLHKFLDVLVLFVAMLLGGILWIGYQRTDAVLSLVRLSLEEYPSINMAAVDRLWPQMWAAAQSSGATAIELHSVDMARNTRVLLKFQVSDHADPKLYGPVGKVKAFLDASFTPIHLAGAAALVTGDAVIGERFRNPEEMALYVPIPDHPGKLLCGIVVVTYPKSTPESDINVARVSLLGFTDEIIQ